jgi:hypothetical protein
MASPATFPSALEPGHRYERKFHLRGMPPEQVALLVRLNPGHFHRSYAPRFVNNVYLDGHDLQSFARHVHGASDRFKLRIRWYGEAAGPVAAPVLEVKIKRGLVGTKARYALEPFTFDESWNIEAHRRAILARVDDRRVAEALGRAQPALFNRYHREYHENSDHQLRLTVDTGLSFSCVRGRSWGPRTRFEERDLTILELKYAVEDEPRAALVAAALPSRVDKVSKYVLGLERLSGLRD